jgi:Fe2+ transport system protein FeoA
MTTLDKVKRGQKVVICKIPDARVREQAIRFGVCEGTVVTCSEKLPAGPVVICKGCQELAIGRGIAQKITIEEAC